MSPKEQRSPRHDADQSSRPADPDAPTLSPVASPVPPADGVVTDERLALLLSLRTEYDELDFKRVVDLSTTGGAVELAKDVGAMQVKGGWIVIGVNERGEPTGDMDGADVSPFDVANLVPKMQRYLHGSLDVVTSVLTKAAHTIVLICVKPNPRGCAFFRIDGEYARDAGEVVTKFRTGEVFWRESTRSVRITMEGLEEIIERRFAARRDDLLREWTAAERALGLSSEWRHEIPSAALPPAPELSFAITPDQVPEIALRLMRNDDEVGVRHLLDDGRRRARIYVENDELAEDQLPLLLDSIICLAAIFLTHEREEWFARVVQLLVDAYAVGGDTSVVERLGFSSQISPQEKAPRVWLAIIERVFALGGFAVRKEAWKAVRTLTVQLPSPVADFGYDANWLRHALTMASRAAGFAQASRTPGSAPASGGEPQLSLIDLARDDAARLDACDPMGPTTKLYSRASLSSISFRTSRRSMTCTALR